MLNHPNGRNNETMNNLLELNRIALWKPKLLDELTMRETGKGRPYSDGGVIKRTTAKTYRYAKNYDKGKQKFCLFVITYTNDSSIEGNLDKIAKKIKVAEITSALETSTDSSFTYTNYYLEEK